ncbi:response regulator transcription factor, partial [Serratia sarumanii]
LTMMLRGLPNKRIATQLSISEPTVKEHISNILKKIGVNSRVEAITLLHGKRDPSQ